MRSVIAGRNPVVEALARRADEIDKIFVQRESNSPVLRRIVSDAQRGGVPVQFVPRQKLDQLAGKVLHQGVVASVAEIGYVDLDEMLTGIGASLDEVARRIPMIVVLDGVQDPHNLGAILRTAAAAGVRGAVVPAGGSAPLSAATVRASAGTAGVVPISRVRKLSDAITQLKERGYWVFGLSGEGSETIWSLDWKRPVALVVGSEGSGLSGSVSAACDQLVRIPMEPDVESLNASVATAVALFAARHGRESKPE